MPNGTNHTNTADGRHVWTRLQLEHAIVLRKYGDLNHSRIAQALNMFFGTTKTASTVQNKLDIEAGTLCYAEVMKRRDRQQPPMSSLWRSIENIGSNSLEVRTILWEYGLITREQWEDWVESHITRPEPPTGTEAGAGNSN